MCFFCKVIFEKKVAKTIMCKILVFKTKQPKNGSLAVLIINKHYMLGSLNKKDEIFKKN